ncbi:hypothetical protein HHK36_023634 [Tetracentron sinense]|uniref:Uncharacterized protein n=1 Tax=Tetracentron sinense TaxID=13715 RepID=A0A834YP33_TETSI|nr:hypothetical protein HHK36_023634 [Tetracentron sinense]
MGSSKIAAVLLISMVVMFVSVKVSEAAVDQACYDDCQQKCMAVPGSTIPVCVEQCTPLILLSLPRMAIRLSLILLLLALALVVESSSFGDAHWGLTYFRGGAHGGHTHTCNGLVGECIDGDDEMMMESEVSRRTLAQRRRFISYGALKKNNVPCNRRGHSYYNCVRSGRANPYRRGCSSITHCARNLS